MDWFFAEQFNKAIEYSIQTNKPLLVLIDDSW